MRASEGTNAFALSRDLKPFLVPITDLKPLGHEVRRHPHQQIRKLAKSLDEYGFVIPILIDAQKRVVAGWGLVLAARKLDLPEVPVIELDNLSEARLRTLRLALNRLGEESSWISDALKLEFSDILKLDSNLDMEISGFDMGEIDFALSRSVDDDEDVVPAPQRDGESVSKIGDLWGLGDHRVLCGNSLVRES
jgi:ParB-like chromosome segregation protein Spo0J